MENERQENERASSSTRGPVSVSKMRRCKGKVSHAHVTDLTVFLRVFERGTLVKRFGYFPVKETRYFFSFFSVAVTWPPAEHKTARVSRLFIDRDHVNPKTDQTLQPVRNRDRCLVIEI